MEVKNIDEYVPRRTRRIYEANVCDLVGKDYYKYVSDYVYDDRTTVRVNGTILKVSDILLKSNNGIIVLRGKSKFYTLLIEYGLSRIYYYGGFNKVYNTILSDVAKNPIHYAALSNISFVSGAIPGRSVTTHLYITKSISAVVSELEFMFNKSIDMHSMAMLVSLNNLSNCDGYDWLNEYIVDYKPVLYKFMSNVKMFLKTCGGDNIGII